MSVITEYIFFRTVYTTRSTAITERLRAVHILKKKSECMQVEQKAHSERMLLPVNKSMQIGKSASHASRAQGIQVICNKISPAPHAEGGELSGKE